ncbi:hypothetical protein F383_26013 [Gossypium arboreum]|uniref:Uncharacterized protein n=1 Tax=Gossypium arboreum TaxID=29729 RepID=A0A0B0NZI9_GOSAR|nr:hypothetical protein F383_26013 [Gossypium arboreum]
MWLFKWFFKFFKCVFKVLKNVILMLSIYDFECWKFVAFNFLLEVD